MRNKISITFIALILIFGIHRLSFAQTHTEHEHSATVAGEQAETQAVIDAGNKICPVSGEKIDEKMKATYEYEGKIYNFCCEMCIDEFKKDPQKYIKKVEEELKAEGRVMEMESESETAHQGPHEGHHH